MYVAGDWHRTSWCQATSWCCSQAERHVIWCSCRAIALWTSPLYLARCLAVCTDLVTICMICIPQQICLLCSCLFALPSYGIYAWHSKCHVMLLLSFACCWVSCRLHGFLPHLLTLLAYVGFVNSDIDSKKAIRPQSAFTLFPVTVHMHL